MGFDVGGLPRWEGGQCLQSSGCDPVNIWGMQGSRACLEWSRHLAGPPQARLCGHGILGGLLGGLAGVSL